MLSVKGASMCLEIVGLTNVYQPIPLRCLEHLLRLGAELRQTPCQWVSSRQRKRPSICLHYSIGKEEFKEL